MKPNSNNKVLSNSVIYTISGLLTKCFSLFLLPLYTSHLTTADYGITNLSTSFTHTVVFIVSFSLFSAIMRFYVDLKDDPEKLSRFYGSVVLFVSASCLVFGFLCFLLRVPLEKYIFSGVDFFPVILVTLVSLFFCCQHTIYDNILRSQQKAMKSSLLSIIYFFTTVGFNILFVVVLKFGAVGVILANALSAVWYTLYFWMDTLRKKEITLCIDWPILKSALKYSVPIMPHNLSTQMAVFFSNVLIGGTDSLSGLGVFSVATQFGAMADTVQNYVYQAYSPWLYEKLKAKEENFKKNIRKISNLLTQVVGLFLIGIALFAHDYIILFVDEAFRGAWKFVVLIVLVYAIKIAYYFYVAVLFYYKKASKKIFIATLTGSLLNVFLSAFLIPALGVYGSILSDGIAMFVRVVIIIGMSRKFDDVGLKAKDFVFNTLLFVFFILAGSALSFFKYGTSFSLFNFAYKIFVVAIYIVIISIKNKNHFSRFFSSFGIKKTIKKDAKK